MKKQILLYGSIYPDTAAKFLTDLEASSGESITVRVNCPGGDPYSTYGMIAKSNEVEVDNILVDGMANSCAAYYVANAAGNKECLSASTFVFHRAATWMEKYPELMTDAIKAELETINGNLRSIIEAKLPKFEKITGVKLDKMFSMDSRIDVRVNAEQAKKMGLVNKVNPLTVAIKAEVESLVEPFRIAAFDNSANTEILTDNKNKKVMEGPTTLAELKAQYPNLFAEAKAEGVTDGRNAEKKRVSAWLKYKDVDPEAVTKAITDGAEMDYEVMADMAVKMAAPAYLEKMKKANVTVETGAAPQAGAKSPEELRTEMFLANSKALREGKAVPHPDFK